jgi:hypothetical protein
MHKGKLVAGQPHWVHMQTDSHPASFPPSLEEILHEDLSCCSNMSTYTPQWTLVSYSSEFQPLVCIDGLDTFLHSPDSCKFLFLQEILTATCFIPGWKARDMSGLLQNVLSGRILHERSSCNLPGRMQVYPEVRLITQKKTSQTHVYSLNKYLGATQWPGSIATQTKV